MYSPSLLRNSSMWPTDNHTFGYYMYIDLGNLIHVYVIWLALPLMDGACAPIFWNTQYKLIMHLSMQIPTHPLPGTSGDLIVSRSSNPAPGVVLLYTQSVVYYMLRILLLELFAKLFAPRGASFAPLYGKSPLMPRRGWVGICIDRCIIVRYRVQGIYTI